MFKYNHITIITLFMLKYNIFVMMAFLDGELYTWGANTHGQCGLGTKSNKETTPQQITSLLGVPISMVACGSNHTFVLSKYVYNI